MALLRTETEGLATRVLHPAAAAMEGKAALKDALDKVATHRRLRDLDVRRKMEIGTIGPAALVATAEATVDTKTVEVESRTGSAPAVVGTLIETTVSDTAGTVRT